MGVGIFSGVGEFSRDYGTKVVNVTSLVQPTKQQRCQLFFRQMWERQTLYARDVLSNTSSAHSFNRCGFTNHELFRHAICKFGRIYMYIRATLHL